MNRQEKEKFLFLLILSKTALLNASDVNVTFDDVSLYMDKFYFKDLAMNKTNLLKFLKDDIDKKIVDFLWAQAIINPLI